jgi:phospholipid/cholesterol/gamma-HCH transport system substrate-binding protein
MSGPEGAGLFWKAEKAMETKANYTLIGAFTALSLLVFAVFVVWLANTGLDRSVTRYDVIFQGPVRGLEPGGEVRFNGIKVGEVEQLVLSRENAKEVVARIKVDSATPVKVDSLAQLEPAGLTGLAFIQILAGGDKSPLLRARIGEGPPVIASRRGQLDRLFSGGEGVLQTSLEALARLNELLSPANVSSLSRTLANVEKATNELSADGALLANADIAAVSIGQAGQDVSLLSRSLNQLIGPAGPYSQFGSSLNELSVQTGGLIQSSETAIVTASEGVNLLTARSQRVIDEAADTLVTSRTALAQVGTAAESLQVTAGQLGTAADNVTQTSTTINNFFETASRQTLPDISRATQTVSSTAVVFDELAQDFQNDPMGTVLPPPEREVRWRQ